MYSVFFVSNVVSDSPEAYSTPAEMRCCHEQWMHEPEALEWMFKQRVEFDTIGPAPTPLEKSHSSAYLVDPSAFYPAFSWLPHYSLHDYASILIFICRPAYTLEGTISDSRLESARALMAPPLSLRFFRAEKWNARTSAIRTNETSIAAVPLIHACSCIITHGRFPGGPALYTDVVLVITIVMCGLSHFTF